MTAEKLSEQDHSVVDAQVLEYSDQIIELVRDMERERTQLEDSRDFYREARNELITERDERIDEAATLQADLAALDEDRGRLQKERDRMEYDRNRLGEFANSELQRARDSRDRHSAQLRAEMDRLRAEVARLIPERDRWRAEVDRAADVVRRLEREKGEWEANYLELANSVPREIGADELREGQTAVLMAGGAIEAGGSVMNIERHGEEVLVDFARPDETLMIAAEHTIVLLSDAPTTGHADHDHQDAEVTDFHDPHRIYPSDPRWMSVEDGIGLCAPDPEPVTAETIRNSEPGSTWEDRDGDVFEWDGARLRRDLQHPNYGSADFLEGDKFGHYEPWSRSTAAPRGNYPDTQPRLTVHDLNVAQVGSVIHRPGQPILVKSNDDRWMGMASEGVVSILPDASTLTHPEAKR